jgi:hypothetical protein
VGKKRDAVAVAVEFEEDSRLREYTIHESSSVMNFFRLVGPWLGEFYDSGSGMEAERTLRRHKNENSLVPYV